MVVAVSSFIAIVPNLDFIFGLIPDPERFEGAKSIVVLVLISRIIDFSFGSNGEMLSNGPYFKWLLYAITGLVLLMIVLNYQLIPIYGMDGAGYALIISFIVFNVAKAWFLYRKEGIQPFSLVHLYVLAIAMPTFFIAELFDILLFHRAVLAYAGITPDEYLEASRAKMNYNGKRKDHNVNGTESAQRDVKAELQGDCPSSAAIRQYEQTGPKHSAGN